MVKKEGARDGRRERGKQIDRARGKIGNQINRERPSRDSGTTQLTARNQNGEELLGRFLYAKGCGPYQALVEKA